MAAWSFTAWNDEIPIVDHATNGLARLLAQYTDAVRLRGIVDIALDGETTIAGATGPSGVQAVEDLAYQFLALRSIYTATGVNLDIVGRIVGLERNAYSASDDIYRLLLLVKIAVNRSESTWDEINAMIVRLGLTLLSSLEYWPATMRTEVADMPADPAGDAIWDLLQDAGAAGVRWDFVWSTRAATDIFTTSSQLAADDASTTQGTANLAGVTGGRLAGSHR